MNYFLSYLMGAESVTDQDLADIGVEIVETKPGGDRTLKIPSDVLTAYTQLIKDKLDNGFWNEVIGENKIIFVFKLKDGSTKEYTLMPENEKEISELCSKFNGDPLEKTANVYKYISGNSFYQELMTAHYKQLIDRPV